MRFTISCKTFLRLSYIPQNFTEDVPEENRVPLRCIRLENHNGNCIAIAANQKVAAIELIGKTKEPDGVVHVVIDEQILSACSNEHDTLEVIAMPQLLMGTVKSMFGFQYVGNPCMFYDSTVMDEWRTWSPKKPVTKSKGALFLNMNYIRLLNQSSPSGRLEFPLYIDVDQPVILRDIENPAWVGLFMPYPPVSNPYQIKGAELPEWWK